MFGRGLRIGGPAARDQTARSRWKLPARLHVERIVLHAEPRRERRDPETGGRDVSVGMVGFRGLLLAEWRSIGALGAESGFMISGWARIPAIQAELKHRRKMSDLVELTEEHKTKIRLALFDMPRELRERYWKETNYGKHPNRITAHLLNAILER